MTKLELAKKARMEGAKYVAWEGPWCKDHFFVDYEDAVDFLIGNNAVVGIDSYIEKCDELNG